MQPGSRSANTTNHDIKATMDLRKSTKAALQRCTLSRHETTFTFSLYLELQRLQTWFGLIASAKRTSHDVAEIWKKDWHAHQAKAASELSKVV